MARILVVDDEISAQEAFRVILKDAHQVLTADSGEKALQMVESTPIDLVILDIIMPKMDGLEVLERIKQVDESIEVIMVTAAKTVKTAVKAMKLGAFDYINKPFDVDEVKISVKKALENKRLKHEVHFLRRELAGPFDFSEIVGKSSSMEEVFNLVRKVAGLNTTVLVTGESGTGKELIARAIHFNSPRKNGPFITLHCAALPETLLESELFGYEKGAFTGATKRKLGRFELADRGTLFLDEIGEMSLSIQAKLLRVIESREFMRVGGVENVGVDVRLIAATNRDLKERVEEGKFRKDLYYRINVVPIHLPPLRERKEDIALLVDYFLKKYSREINSPVKSVSPEALTLLQKYSWPGNIRELANTMERMIVLASGEVIEPSHLPPEISRGEEDKGLQEEVFKGEISLEEARSRFEKILIENALRETGGVQSKAARLLKTTRRILKYKMMKYGIK